MRASERAAHYASRFPLVEMEATYRFPPTPAVAQQWVDRTPEGFCIDVQCWSLLTGQPTIPGSLWEDLVPEVRPDRRDRQRLYATHLSDAGLTEAWARFVHALAPLAESGRLGAVVLRFPRWFGPRPENEGALADARLHLGDLPVAIELCDPAWTDPSRCDRTFDLFEDLRLAFVCVDAAPNDPRGLGGATGTTTDLAVLRMRGRRSPDVPEEERWNPDRRAYRYDERETAEVASRVRRLAEGASDVHVLVSTCWRDDAVRNAAALQDALTR